MISESVISEFLAVPQGTTDENEWNGAWNVLLNMYFPFAEGWVVKPQARAPKKNQDAVDFCVVFKIELNRIPAMFVEIKPLANLGLISARKEADSQMRQRFIDFYDASPTIFTGISAFGHIICKYELDKEDNRITPKAVPDSLDYVVDVAPRERWDLDLTTDEGGRRILEIFNEVVNVMTREALCQKVQVHSPQGY